MHICALPQGLRRLSLAELPRERWRNGAGWTRTVASEQGAQGLRWRVSLAEITQAGAFSLFPGLDRTAVLVRGGPVHLRQAFELQCGWTLSQPGDCARFAGEELLDNLAPADEALVWNLMVARGQARAQVRISAHEALRVDTRQHTLVWLLQGQYVVMTEDCTELTALGSDEGLHGHPGGQGWQLRPASADARLLVTEIS